MRQRRVVVLSVLARLTRGSGIDAQNLGKRRALELGWVAAKTRMSLDESGIR
jgi:hypothetical protein